MSYEEAIKLIRELERENDDYHMQSIEADDKIARLEHENGQFIHDNNQLLHENNALRLQADMYFEQWQALKDRMKAKPLTELQLTKDSSVQGVPLTNEAYEKLLNGEDE